MDDKKIRWLYTKPLSASELQDIADKILTEDLPLDNNLLTDEDESDSEDTNPDSNNDFADSIHITAENGCAYDNTIEDPQPSCSTVSQHRPSPQVDASVSHEQVPYSLLDENSGKNLSTRKKQKILRPKNNSKEKEVDDEYGNEEMQTRTTNRKWKKAAAEELMPEFHYPEGPVETEFIDCKSVTDVYLRLLGESVDDIVFQSNLYATQRNHALNLSREELLAFIGINMLMAYHRLPTWKQYWNASEDLGLPIVAKCMTRNRFETILKFLHCNDNNLMPKDNKDKIYKIRPLSDTLNRRFKDCYKTTRRVSVDESMILFKGRSTLKQYNPMKPIKRGYKLWCLADQNAYVATFDVYQGKNEELKQEFKEFGLGERVVLSLTKPEWNKWKIIYADNYFISISLLETLYLKKTLACGTIRSKRLGLPPMRDDKDMKRGDHDFRVSNTGIRVFKWKDNKIVHFASNFHGTEEVHVKRTQKDGTRMDVKCPSVVADYNKHMGGVDRADQLRSTYGVIRRSRKWWHRLFWGLLDIAFVNAYIIYNMQFEKISTLEFRRSICLGFMATNYNNVGRKKSGPIVKRRKYNYSVPDDIRLGNRGAHWVVFGNNRGRCEMCSSRAIQSRPQSKCSTCGIFLCCNHNKNCFLEYHEID